MNEVWSNLHANYKDKDWISKPSIFAQTAIKYFPKKGKILELGAGQAQDSMYFAQNGYEVVSTDIEDSAQELAKSRLVGDDLDIAFQKLDLREEFSFDDASFEVVYAHLSVHYFDYESTVRLFGEVQRVLKPGGVFAFLTNSVNDPEYKTGKELEEDFFQIKQATKRFLSVDTARNFAQYFEVNLLDDMGETYKDNEKGVHNLIRFVGKKPLKMQKFKMAIPYVGAIIEREVDGKKEVLLQTRWNRNSDPLYAGTLEFPAGTLDKPYENIYDTIAREIREETGLTLKSVQGDSRTKVYSPKNSDEIFAFRPFCCTQQLKDGKPWVGFVFVCEVENGDPVSQLSEAKDAQWMVAEEVESLVSKSPEMFFGLELPAWEYYFSQKP